MPVPVKQTHKPGNFLSKVPIRVLLTVLFGAQVCTMVAIVGWLSYRSSRAAVGEATSELRRETSDRIKQKINFYIEIPHKINNLNISAVEQGLLNLDDQNSIERYFWRQMQIFDLVSYIAIATETGDFVGVQRQDDGSLQIKIANQSTRRAIVSFTLDQNGNRLKKINELADYSPTDRPWYKDAKANQQATWQDIVTFFSTEQLGAILAQPFYDRAGQLMGVSATSLLLSQISDFLQEIRIGSSGQTFIIDREGILIATSTAEEAFLEIEGGQQRLAASQSSNPLTKATANFLGTEFESLKQINTNQKLDFELDRAKIFLEVAPLSDGRGIDWLIVVVILKTTSPSRFATMPAIPSCCLIALIIAIVLAFFTSKWITFTIQRLSQAAKAISLGDWEQRSVNMALRSKPVCWPNHLTDGWAIASLICRTRT
jgi:adenylate cyclase